MTKSVTAIYRDGKIEWLEKPPEVPEARVLVTFLPPEPAAGQPPALTPEEVAELRWRFQAFAEDWERPEMDVYDKL